MILIYYDFYLFTRYKYIVYVCVFCCYVCVWNVNIFIIHCIQLYSDLFFIFFHFQLTWNATQCKIIQKNPKKIFKNQIKLVKEMTSNHQGDWPVNLNHSQKAIIWLFKFYPEIIWIERWRRRLNWIDSAKLKEPAFQSIPRNFLNISAFIIHHRWRVHHSATL